MPRQSSSMDHVLGGIPHTLLSLSRCACVLHLLDLGLDTGPNMLYGFRCSALERNATTVDFAGVDQLGDNVEHHDALRGDGPISRDFGKKQRISQGSICGR